MAAMKNSGRSKTLITDFVWRADLPALSRLARFGVCTMRISWAVARDFAEGQISLRAMSLVYTTLLSLIPLLAISFSVLKGFGVHNQIEPLLLDFLAPLGDKGVEIGTRIIGFVENVKAGVLGSVGLGLLVYTVISLMQKIERAFNYIWHVTQQRSFAQRFSGYLSVIMIGPVLVFSSLGITASLTSTSVVVALTSIEPFGTLIRLAGSVLPYVLAVGAFTFIYMFMPNTRVRFQAALIGAAVAGLMWDVSGWAFASFIVGSTQYTAIYSAFAALVIFMIWLYVSWLILLVGANIAFYRQHPEHLSPQRGELQMSSRQKEHLALAAASAIADEFCNRRKAPGLDALAHRLHVPITAVERVLAPLVGAGLLTRTGDDPAGWLPAYPPETIPAKTVLDAIRAEGGSASLNPARLSGVEAVDDVMTRLDRAAEQALEGRTLRDLAEAGAAPVALKPAPPAQVDETQRTA